MKKMNLFKKITKTLITTTCIYTLFVCSVAFAKGTVSIKADKEKINNGDEFSVTVEAKDKGDSSVAPEISITYDTNRLLFNDCSVEYGGGQGGLITIKDTNANISFTSLSGGTAEVDVSVTFDGDGTNTSAASAYIEVEGEDTAQANGDAGSASNIEAGIIETADSSRVVSTVFADEFMPVGFHKATTTYEEQMVDCAKFDMGDITLIYVMDSDGNNGGFSIYNEQTKELSDFLQIMGIENKFIIALNTDASVNIPSNVTKATLEWNSQKLEAFVFNSDVISEENVQMSDFFLIYAVSSEGNKGFYMYDKADGTYQRYVGFSGNVTGAPNTNNTDLLNTIGNSDTEGQSFIQAVNNSSNVSKGATLLSYQVMGFDAKIVVIAVLLLIVIILLIIITVSSFGRDRDDFYYYGDDENDEDNSEENLEENLEDKFIVESDKRNHQLEIDSKSDSDDEAAKKEDNEFKSEHKVTKDENEDNDVEISEEIVDDEVYNLEDDSDEVPLTKKEQKALEKAKKKEEKRLKKEYGEHGPVDWAEFENIVKSDDERRPSAKSYDELPDYMKEDSDDKKNEEENEVSEADKGSEPLVEEKAKNESGYDFPTKPKENPMKMMRGIPANDNNARVQPKPVQQVELDEDFEFEFLKFDDDD